MKKRILLGRWPLSCVNQNIRFACSGTVHIMLPTNTGRQILGVLLGGLQKTSNSNSS